MEKKTETSKDPKTALDPFAAFEPLSSVAWMGTAWFERVADLGSEVTTFISERIKEDIKTQHALLHCKSLTEVRHVQAEFLQKAFDQYQAETGKLIKMTGTTAVGDPNKDHTCI